MPHLSRDEALALLSGDGDGSKTMPMEAVVLLAQLDDQKFRADLEAQEHAETLDMRKGWSKWILRAILAIVVFDFFVVTFTGFGWMRFDAPWFIPAFVGESLLQTIGLAVIIVRFLFSQRSHGRQES